MSVPTLIRRELKNARVYFIPAGATVDAVTVAVATWPDNVPPTNWTAYQFPDIETVVQETAESEEEFLVPRSTGGYINDPEKSVTSRMWKATTARTNSYVKQLEYGLASVPVAGTAQAPGVRHDNFILGVMLLEQQNKNGVIIERLQVWAKMRLVSAGQTGPATTKVEVSWEMQESANNTFVANAG